MPARFRLALEPRPQGVLEAILDSALAALLARLCDRPPFLVPLAVAWRGERVRRVEEDPRRVVGERGERAREQIDPAVRARRDDVVLQHDGAALRGPDQAGVHVTAGVGLAALRVAGRQRAVAVLLQPERGRAHRDEPLEAVAAPDVHVERDRAQAMRRVQVAVPLEVLEAPPQALALVLEQQRAQVVDVGALGVRQLAEDACPHHVEHEHLAPAVAAVLEDRAVPARRFGGVDELPALLDRLHPGHLAAHVRAALHRGDRHGQVPVPGRRDVDQVEVASLAEVLEVVVAVGVAVRLLLAGLDNGGLRLRHLLGHDVADGLQLDARHVQDVTEQAAAAAAAADQREAHAGALLERHAGHRRAALRRRGRQLLCCARASEAERGGGAGGRADQLPARERTG